MFHLEISDTFRNRGTARCDCRLNASGSGHCPVAGSCEHGNEPSESIKAGNFFTSWASNSLSRRTLLYELIGY